MENVPDVIGTKNINLFNEWYAALEKLGYQSYYKILNAKDFGIPQNRARCFMVSILGDYNYEFPKPISLELRLKDILEDQIDEKYYLSESQVKYFTEHSVECKEKGTGFRFTTSDGETAAKTITTRSGSRMDDNFIEEAVQQIGNCIPHKNRENPSQGRVYDKSGLSPTLSCMEGGNRQPMILEPTICASRGRNPGNPKSRLSGLPTEQKLEVNISGCSNTLTTVQKDNLVLETGGWLSLRQQSKVIQLLMLEITLT